VQISDFGCSRSSRAAGTILCASRPSSCLPYFSAASRVSNVAQIFFVLRYVHETRGKELEQMEG
jgi:hypothetical protein